MSKSAPARPTTSSRSSFSFAIVASSYNGKYTDALAETAGLELKLLEAGAKVDVFRTPGSFEVPLFVKLAAKKKKYDAILAFGVIFQGATEHATLIADSVTQSLQNIALEFSIPVLHEVLLLSDEKQARERCLGKKLNRGLEAARAAVTAVREIKKSF
jgi:6,7-dimethyl-8-ribityllumazine synthase